MIKSAYIHIPFCKSKCHYCSFVSFDDLSAKEMYMDALKSQMKAEYFGVDDVGVEIPTSEMTKNCMLSFPLSARGQNKLNTLYFGGGTPSLLTIEEFKSLLDIFEFEPDAEITVEVNPDSVDFEYLSALRALGINRLSIGVQTFDDQILELIGRRHSSIQAKDAVEAARRAAFKNISVDFIYGLPTQTLKGFESDLKTAINLGVQHISLYGLKIDAGCYFKANQPQTLPDDDIQADMYLKAVEMLKTNDFEHYEVSNFSRLGFNSRHNLNYWENNAYYGFGCAASGYNKKIRYQNEPELYKYIKNPFLKASQQQLLQKEILEEAIFLGLRKMAGINIEEINQTFKIDFNKKYAKILEKYSDFFVKTQTGWALNLEGILISNDILAEFIDLY